MTRQIQLTLASVRPRAAVPGRTVLDPSVTRMRVRPGDLDMYLHVNNGVYLQMMDVARSNFLADLGAFALLKEKSWGPVVASSTMTYRRSLRLWDRFEITSRVLGWDPRVVYMEQVFTRHGERCARGVVAARFLTRTGERVPGDRVAEALDPGVVSPALPDDVARWADAVGVAHRA
ncbi:acyl-CoA thioesterase [Cellulomonas sp. PhB143]|uniref:acyl-CoA thioesterase n=1 Tax=Cellulomonas sp. PhB143 TaxID=2485186 RepID=UPI000F47F158|nr:acyl-CoA thioesterase [Cellulomonas sp. PhB143]ROS73031.1 YbgC/YbaW family acyl-CoA thioester hydrolase [Cellulomonas sp. PhB143]